MAESTWYAVTNVPRSLPAVPNTAGGHRIRQLNCMVLETMTTGTATLTAAAQLAERIVDKTARVGIIGLGYVGLPLAVEFAKAGFSVTGIDVSQEKVRRVNAGDSYVGDVASAILGPLVESGKLRATTDFSSVLDLDTVNICVPT